jgi:hypothetical protein
MQHIQLMHPGWVRQNIPQELVSQEILPSWSNNMSIPRLNTRESLENTERRLREPCPKPWSSAWFLVHALVDVAEKAGEELFFPGFGFKMDEEGFAAGGAVDAIYMEDRVGWVSLGPTGLMIGEFGFPG